MGLFGGSSSSSSSTTNQTDNRRVLGDGSISAENSTITVNALDGDVVNRALDSVDSGVMRALTFGGRALDYATESQAQAAGSLADQSKLIASAYEDAKGRGALTDKIMIGAVLMAGLVAIFALKK